MSKSKQTFISFRDKWENNKNLAFEETLNEKSDIFNWILKRNGFNTTNDLKKYLESKLRILDAGCGNGRVTALLHRYASENAELIGIDLTAANVAKNNLSKHKRVNIYSKDLLGELNDLGKFDFIYCQEVLHHTSDPKKAFFNLCERLSPKGEIAIYVYKIKAPIREYSDDMVRNKISNLSYGEAISYMKELTELGRLLSELNVNIKVPQINILGIESGEYHIQRLIHNFFFKCFWNPEMSFDDNVAINYDWYHPQICTRHTIEEVQSWYKEAGLEVVHSLVDHYGITVRGIKNT